MQNISDYHKISDILFRFDNNIVFKFTTILSYVDSFGSTKFSHTEYKYNITRKSKTETVKSVNRFSNYYVSFESKNDNIASKLILKSGDFYQFKVSINKFVQNENSKNTTMQIQSGQFITLTRKNSEVYVDFDSLFKVKLESFKLIEFISIINEINMIQMWNNHILYISTSNFIGNDFNLKDLDSNDFSNTSTKSKYKINNNKKSSFFSI